MSLGPPFGRIFYLIIIIIIIIISTTYDDTKTYEAKCSRHIDETIMQHQHCLDWLALFENIDNLSPRTLAYTMLNSTIYAAFERQTTHSQALNNVSFKLSTLTRRANCLVATLQVEQGTRYYKAKRHTGENSTGCSTHSAKSVGHPCGDQNVVQWQSENRACKNYQLSAGREFILEWWYCCDKANAAALPRTVLLFLPTFCPTQPTHDQRPRFEAFSGPRSLDSRQARHGSQDVSAETCTNIAMTTKHQMSLEVMKGSCAAKIGFVVHSLHRQIPIVDNLWASQPQRDSILKRRPYFLFHFRLRFRCQPFLAVGTSASHQPPHWVDNPPGLSFCSGCVSIICWVFCMWTRKDICW
jgi:hypothetical protein